MGQRGERVREVEREEKLKAGTSNLHALGCEGMVANSNYSSDSFDSCSEQKRFKS